MLLAFEGKGKLVSTGGGWLETGGAQAGLTALPPGSQVPGALRDGTRPGLRLPPLPASAEGSWPSLRSWDAPAGDRASKQTRVGSSYCRREAG